MGSDQRQARSASSIRRLLEASGLRHQLECLGRQAISRPSCILKPFYHDSMGAQSLHSALCPLSCMMRPLVTADADGQRQTDVIVSSTQVEFHVPLHEVRTISLEVLALQMTEIRPALDGMLGFLTVACIACGSY